MPSAITDAFIFEAIRTPRGTGKRSGALHGVKPIDLVVGLIDELRGRFPDLDEQRISDVILGCVTPVGEHQALLQRTAGAFPRDPMDTRLAGYLSAAVESRPAAWTGGSGQVLDRHGAANGRWRGVWIGGTARRDRAHP